MSDEISILTHISEENPTTASPSAVTETGFFDHQPTAPCYACSGVVFFHWLAQRGLRRSAGIRGAALRAIQGRGGSVLPTPRFRIILQMQKRHSSPSR
ncbi:hypothetical protein [Dickeya fangzhongdai]|uniref:hypothetical protein n=1 Tax=Dickeya fangzhongdai TaxID=1778540 RepID=UPI0026DF13A3|nr:hypothetical protein [Dickeya fangzhongdai]WKV50720.1 hypothetical protein PL145_23440 [Dickeya fangzhongdai]